MSLLGVSYSRNEQILREKDWAPGIISPWKSIFYLDPSKTHFLAGGFSTHLREIILTFPHFKLFHNIYIYIWDGHQPNSTSLLVWTHLLMVLSHPKMRIAFPGPTWFSLISFISSWVARWAAGLFKTTFLHIYTRDRHGDDVPERLELRTVEQVRIETSETSERVEWFRVKVFWKDWWLGQWFPQHFCRIVLPNSGVPFWRSLHTFASGSSLILSRFRMYGSLLEWGYHRSWLRR